MKPSNLSITAQDGLRRFFEDVDNDPMALDAISSVPEQWAWLCFRLREAADKPEWFPKGKFATIQFIESLLAEEARMSLPK